MVSGRSICSSVLKCATPKKKCALLLHFAAQVLAFLASEASAAPDAVLGMCMRLGGVNFKVMALLDDAHTSRCAPHNEVAFSSVVQLVLWCCKVLH